MHHNRWRRDWLKRSGNLLTQKGRKEGISSRGEREIANITGWWLNVIAKHTKTCSGVGFNHKGIILRVFIYKGWDVYSKLLYTPLLVKCLGKVIENSYKLRYKRGSKSSFNGHPVKMFGRNKLKTSIGHLIISNSLQSVPSFAGNW